MSEWRIHLEHVHNLNVIVKCHLIVFAEKLLGLNLTAKDENNKVFTLPPPIITHTDATPMGTPQGSPNEHNDSDLTVGKASDVNSLTVEVPAVRLNSIVLDISIFYVFSTVIQKECL